MNYASNTYRGCLVTSSADLLGQPLLTVYNPMGLPSGSSAPETRPAEPLTKPTPRNSPPRGCCRSTTAPSWALSFPEP
jgi:hypothetical protein